MNSLGLNFISPIGALRMWQRNWHVFRKIFFRATAPTFFEPFIYLFGLGVGLGLFVADVNGFAYIEFLAPGLLASSTMFGASYEATFGSFVRLKYEKAYEAALATPLNIEDVVVGEMLWAATRSFLGAVVYLAVITAFGLTKSPAVILLVPALFIFALLFAIIGMTFTAFISEISLFNYYFTLFITPMFLLSGIFFPVEALPAWAQTLASVTPLFHIVRVSRGLVLGTADIYTLASFAVILLATVLLFLVPVLLMKRRLIK